MCVCIPGLSVVFHGSVRLSLCWFHAVLMAPALTSGRVSPQLCFSFQRCFDYSRFFCTSIQIVESVADFPHKKSAGVLVALVWNLLINLKVNDSLTEWSRWTREPGPLPSCVHLVSSSSVSWCLFSRHRLQFSRQTHPEVCRAFCTALRALTLAVYSQCIKKKWTCVVNLVSYSRCNSVWCGLVCLP